MSSYHLGIDIATKSMFVDGATRFQLSQGRAVISPGHIIFKAMNQTIRKSHSEDSTNLSAMDIAQFQQPIFCALVTLETILGFYLLVAVVYSEWKLRNAAVTSSQMHAKRLRRCCLFAMTVGTTHLFINIYAVMAPPSPKSCVLRLAAQKVSYCAGMFSVYGFLWLRQKLFYSNPSLRYLYSKKLRFFSWSVLCIILICFLCQCTMTIFAVMQSEKHVGNTLSNNTTCINPQKKLWMVQISLAALSSFLVHISLMSLFLFPLCKHSLENSSFFVRASNGSFVSRSSVQYRSSAVHGGGDSVTATPSGDSRKNLQAMNNNKPRQSLEVYRPSIRRRQQMEQQKQKFISASDKLRALIIRCLTLTAICVLVSITVTIVTVTLYHGGLLATFLYGSNMLVNMACCTGCFSHWPSTLLPFCVRHKKRKVEVLKKQSPSDVSQRLIGRRYDSVI